MIKVRKDYGEGGAGLQGPGNSTALHRPIGEVLQGLIDDDDAALPAAIASPDATDLASAITLVNEIKAALNAASTAAATKNVVKG
jgi:hypothetical protein